MIKPIATLLLLCLSAVSVAEESEQAPPPLDPAYMGVHGMVLMHNSSKVYASHLPLYHPPHDAQLIYKNRHQQYAFCAAGA